MAQLRQLLITGFFLAAGAACGGGGGSGGSNIPTDPTGGGNNNNSGGVTHSLSVTVTSSGYTPGTTTVAKGSTVQWTWNTCTSDGYGSTGEQCVEHTVTFDDGATSVLQDKGTFSRTFDAAGTYTYHCKVHGIAMSGQVKVE